MQAKHIFWLVLWGFYFIGIYTPSMRKFRKKKLEEERTRIRDAVLDFLTFFAWQIFPLVHIFSDWFAYADYSLPDWTNWIGGASFVLSMIVLQQAYQTLGQNWSPKIDVREGQKLVTTGIYGLIRHPIYAGIWLWAIANALLLHNLIAGPTMIVLFAILYFTRTPREEEMMRAHFGEDYRQYEKRTGRVIPRFRRNA